MSISLIRIYIFFRLLCSYATCTSSIMYRICPAHKFCISIVFSFSRDGCNTREKWKTKVMQNLGMVGANKVHYGGCTKGVLVSLTKILFFFFNQTPKLDDIELNSNSQLQSLYHLWIFTVTMCWSIFL